METKSSLKRFLSLPLGQKLTVLFSQPILLFLLLRTYWRFYKNVLKTRGESEYITGFSPLTAILFTYYLRGDECVKKYGERGYVYEDGLGFSLKERFWLNPIALKIYNKLKIRKFTLLTAFILFFSIITIGFLEGIIWWKLGVLIILIAGSSLFIVPFFRLAKPETLSWAFLPLAFYSFFKGYYLFSVLLTFSIAVLNFTVALLTIETILLYALFSANFVNGILVSIIPSIKLLFDLTPFFKKSFAGKLFEVLGGGKKVKSQSKTFLRIRPNDVYLTFFYLIFFASFVISGAPLIYLIILINPLVLFLINQNLFRFADNHTFFKFFFVISSVFVIIQPTTLTFLTYILFIYISSVGLLETIEDIIKKYPHLKPYSIKKANQFLENFFSKIFPHSRIIFETEGTEKSLAGFRLILTYFEYILFKRGIEFLPMEWLRLTQFDYFTKEYIKINNKSGKETIEEKLKELGGSYLMVYSEDFANSMRKWGYKEIGRLKWEELKRIFWDYEEIIEYGYERKDLYLFRPPFEASRIEPVAQLKIEPNRMEFNAKAGEEYIIKYTYHPSWRAYQNEKEIKVYQSKGKLSYIALKPEEDGKVVLKFNTSWLN